MVLEAGTFKGMAPASAQHLVRALSLHPLMAEGKEAKKSRERGDKEEKGAELTL